MVSVRFVRSEFKWRTAVRDRIETAGASGLEDERAKFREGSKEAETSDDILFVYLVDLDGV